MYCHGEENLKSKTSGLGACIWMLRVCPLLEDPSLFVRDYDLRTERKKSRAYLRLLAKTAEGAGGGVLPVETLE
jgi:hypothetical protein